MVKEDALKQRIERLRTENEKLQQYKFSSDSEYAYLKNKYQNSIDKNKLLRLEIEKLNAKIDMNNFGNSGNENSVEINCKNS